MLSEFIVAHRAELIARTRVKVARRLAPRPTERELETGVPLFLDQLTAMLLLATPSMSETMDLSAAAHGAALLNLGYTVAQVVHDYGDVCQAVTEVAAELGATISADEFHTLNLCLDNAIAEAITEYTRLRDVSAVEAEMARSGALVHELRNRISAAKLAFEAIQTGRAPLGGSVATVITRSLTSMASLTNQVMLEVRVDSRSTHRVHLSLHELIDEAEIDGTLEGDVYGVSLVVSPTDRAIHVMADSQILAGALANLLQNAFKFSRRGGQVSLTTSVVEGRVRIAVEDQCGGLPSGKADELFEAFQKGGANRDGLGLGLFISRKGIEASGGTLAVRDAPGAGCVFTIELPVLPTTA
jgi:signal transduction histidine kinase